MEFMSPGVIQTIAGTRCDHGGTSRSVPNLCNALAALGTEVELLTGVPHDSTVPCNFPATPVHTTKIVESRRARQWGMRRRFELALVQRLRKMGLSSRPICVHDHGLWLATNRACAKTTARLNVPRIVSPRGMLSSWSLQSRRWKKSIAWKLFQQKDLHRATAFHATGDLEVEDIRRLGFRQPIALIPNGVQVPSQQLGISERSSRSTVREVLFLSRIHPKKGLLNLVQAWKDTAPADCRLVIAGPDENGHRKEVEQLAQKLGVADRISFPGPVSDNEKWKLYDSADLFVLPSFSENFGIVVAEALSAGLPVLATTATPWKSLQSEHMGWWFDPDVESLTSSLREAFSLAAEERTLMGEKAIEWSRNNYQWEGIARKMTDFYKYLLGHASRPDFVHTA